MKRSGVIQEHEVRAGLSAQKGLALLQQPAPWAGLVLSQALRLASAPLLLLSAAEAVQMLLPWCEVGCYAEGYWAN